MTKSEETAYTQGSRMAWMFVLQNALRELSYDDPAAVKAATWAVEREAAIQALRSLCRNFGDNDWRECLSLADIIDKHLGDHLRRTDELMKEERKKALEESPA